jgi:hypothetical protein
VEGGGWGAGSFGVVHLLYRRNTLTVQQPHSVPLQFLAETGIVGALLAIGGFVLVATSAGGLTRRLSRGPERLLAAGLFGGVIAYAAHSLYDWDWDIPAVTLPMFMFLGVLVGARRRSLAGAVASRPSATARALSLGALTLWLCAFALSAALPSWSASTAASALVKASSGSPSTLHSAESSAKLASDLDPLSDAGLRVEATIAVHLGRLPRARGYLTQAVGREPTDIQAWQQLAEVDVLMGNARGASVAAQRLLDLDPHGPSAALLRRARVQLARPSRSATAVQTPEGAK